MRFVIKLLLVLVFLFSAVAFLYGCSEDRLEDDTNVISRQESEGDALGASPPDHSPAVVRDESIDQDGNDYKIIVMRNIFAAGLDGKPVVGEPEEEIEETGLNLILQGTITGSKQDSGAIIVDEKNRRQDLYSIGDEIQGALITAIERGEVVLEVDGKKEVLLIKERTVSPVRTSSKPALRTPATSFTARPPTTGLPVARVNNQDDSVAVPVAVPQRRISFRQKGAEPVEPVEPVEQGMFDEELRGYDHEDFED